MKKILEFASKTSSPAFKPRKSLGNSHSNIKEEIDILMMNEDQANLILNNRTSKPRPNFNIEEI